MNYGQKGSQIINDIANGAGAEFNNIFNGPVLKLLGGSLMAIGVVGVFWGFGKMRQGDKAMKEIIFSVVALVSGTVLLTQKFDFF